MSDFFQWQLKYTFKNSNALLGSCVVNSISFQLCTDSIVEQTLGSKTEIPRGGKETHRPDMPVLCSYALHVKGTFK
jgi:hypothetical protein